MPSYRLGVSVQLVVGWSWKEGTPEARMALLSDLKQPRQDEIWCKAKEVKQCCSGQDLKTVRHCSLQAPPRAHRGEVGMESPRVELLRSCRDTLTVLNLQNQNQMQIWSHPLWEKTEKRGFGQKPNQSLSLCEACTGISLWSVPALMVRLDLSLFCSHKVCGNDRGQLESQTSTNPISFPVFSHQRVRTLPCFGHLHKCHCFHNNTNTEKRRFYWRWGCDTTGVGGSENRRSTETSKPQRNPRLSVYRNVRMPHLKNAWRVHMLTAPLFQMKHVVFRHW